MENAVRGGLARYSIAILGALVCGAVVAVAAGDFAIALIVVVGFLFVSAVRGLIRTVTTLSSGGSFVQLADSVFSVILFSAIATVSCYSVISIRQEYRKRWIEQNIISGLRAAAERGDALPAVVAARGLQFAYTRVSPFAFEIKLPDRLMIGKILVYTSSSEMWVSQPVLPP